MNPQIQALEQKIDMLAKQVSSLSQVIDSLSNSSMIPRDIENAFAERLPFINASLGTGTPGATVSFSSFPVVVPANPSGTLLVRVGGVPYALLYK